MTKKREEPIEVHSFGNIDQASTQNFSLGMGADP